MGFCPRRAGALLFDYFEPFVVCACMPVYIYHQLWDLVVAHRCSPFQLSVCLRGIYDGF